MLVTVHKPGPVRKIGSSPACTIAMWVELSSPLPSSCESKVSSVGELLASEKTRTLLESDPYCRKEGVYL